jgi:hypothetical protein
MPIQVAKKRPGLALGSPDQRKGPAITGPAMVSFAEAAVMRQDNARTMRLLRECEVPVGAFVILAAACPVIALILILTS